MIILLIPHHRIPSNLITMTKNIRINFSPSKKLPDISRQFYMYEYNYRLRAATLTTPYL